MENKPTYQELEKRIQHIEYTESELKLTERALQESEENYQILLENTREAVFVTQDGKIIFNNPRSAELSGYTAEELQSRPFIEFIHEDDREMVSINYLRRLRGDALPERYSFRIIHKSGGIRWIEIHAVVIQWNGKASILYFMTDIHERKKAEKQLQEKEAFLDLLMAMATQMVNTPLEKVGEQLTSMLRETGIFLGLDRVYIFTNDYDRRISINTHEWCADVVSSEIENMQAVPLDQIKDILETHQRGEPFIVQRVSDLSENNNFRKIIEPQGIRTLLLIPMIYHGEYLGYVGFDAVREEINITETQLKLFTVFAELIVNVEIRQKNDAERVTMQTQLTQAQKMESVGRLAGGVAHDFNNMLGVILGHVELAFKKAEKKQDLHANLKVIQTAAQRSADLTKQLLTFARKQIISPKPLDLNDTVESILDMLQRLIGEDIDLLWQPDAHLWPVKIDPSQIDQILANLCVNSRDAISGVGRLTIETGRKTFDKEYCSKHQGFFPGDFVLLAVSDDGCGMDKATLDNLFEPFFTTKQVGKGTGLGLSTVYGIVKQNNGFINVYSEPGHGSTIRIYLPRLVDDDHVSTAAPEKKTADGGTETILLVEDEPLILEMTTTMLQTLGYTVLVAPAPDEAIRQAKGHTGPVHLLMTDMVMPEMNGRDLAEQIIALYPGIRILFMSGYTANVIAHQGVLDDGVAFIQKPFSMTDMAVKLREMLEPS